MWKGYGLHCHALSQLAVRLARWLTDHQHPQVGVRLLPAHHGVGKVCLLAQPNENLHWRRPLLEVFARRHADPVEQTGRRVVFEAARWWLDSDERIVTACERVRENIVKQVSVQPASLFSRIMPPSWEWCEGAPREESKNAFM